MNTDTPATEIQQPSQGKPLYTLITTNEVSTQTFYFFTKNIAVQRYDELIAAWQKAKSIDTPGNVTVFHEITDEYGGKATFDCKAIRGVSLIDIDAEFEAAEDRQIVQEFSKKRFQEKIAKMPRLTLITPVRPGSPRV
jgi:hypothetical protein